MFKDSCTYGIERKNGDKESKIEAENKNTNTNKNGEARTHTDYAFKFIPIIFVTHYSCVRTHIYIACFFLFSVIFSTNVYLNYIV